MTFTPPADATVDSEGIWCQVHHRIGPDRPALFLDRDGVVVVEVGYLHEPEKAELIPGAADVVKRANALEVAVVFVTNQAGIARGYYGWAEFHATQERIFDLLAAEGARVDAVYACPHHKDGIEGYRHASHPARKPNPGMLTRAADALSLDMASSWIVGDRAGDLEAGRNAGLAGGLHVTTGHGARDGEIDKARAVATDGYRVILGDGISEALSLPLLG